MDPPIDKERASKTKGSWAQHKTTCKKVHAEQEFSQEEFSQPHHPDSDEAELAALKNIAQSHPYLHVGFGIVRRRNGNGQPSKSGWLGVYPENDTRRKGPWRAKTGEGGKIDLARGSLLRCVEAVRDDPYRLGTVG